MVSVTNATKAAWLDETSHKEYEVIIDDGLGQTTTFSNNVIKKDSISISASIMQSNTIEFGGCIARKLEIVFDGPHILGGGSGDINYPVTLRARADNTEWISLFTGTIYTYEEEESTSWLKYTAYDAFYDLANMDVTNYYNTYNGGPSLDNVFFDFYLHIL